MTPDRSAAGERPATEVGFLTCPRCGSEAPARMPDDACVVRWTCPACASEVRPRTGDCCVFCSYGSRPCPPERASGAC